MIKQEHYSYTEPKIVRLYINIIKIHLRISDIIYITACSIQSCTYSFLYGLYMVHQFWVSLCYCLSKQSPVAYNLVVLVCLSVHSSVTPSFQPVLCDSYNITRAACHLQCKCSTIYVPQKNVYRQILYVSLANKNCGMVHE